MKDQILEMIAAAMAATLSLKAERPQGALTPPPAPARKAEPVRSAVQAPPLAA